MSAGLKSTSLPSSFTEEIPLHPRCVPLKRRLIQQPYPQQWTDNLRVMPSKLLSPNTCLQTMRDLYSPPVSPKTIVPISHASQPHQPQRQQSACPTVMRPCHICYRRPTTWEVLDAYANCSLCGERACYICLRQCDSPVCCGAIEGSADGEVMDFMPVGHSDGKERRQKRVVCSLCAVEGMTDTGKEVVRCLDCVRTHISQWPTISPGSIIPVRNGMGSSW